MPEKILSCACGSDALEMNQANGRMYIRCLDCGNTERGSHTSWDAAITAWNKSSKLTPHTPPNAS